MSGAKTLWPSSRTSSGSETSPRLAASVVHCLSATKKRRYEQFGLPELWLVDTAANVVFAFRRSSPQVPEFDIALDFTRAQSLTSPLLPGFTLALDTVFESDEITT